MDRNEIIKSRLYGLAMGYINGYGPYKICKLAYEDDLIVQSGFLKPFLNKYGFIDVEEDWYSYYMSMTDIDKLPPKLQRFTKALLKWLRENENLKGYKYGYFR